MSPYSPAFLRDLRREFSTGGVNLSDLAARLDRWRADTRKRLAREVRRLPPDDPLLCPVGLFGPLDLGRLETAQTRALAWLLDPRRPHGFGTRLLAAFLSLVWPGKDWSAVTADRVEAEWLTNLRDADTASRLDVYAVGRLAGGTTRRWVLAVEAKIDAGEGEEQLDRYDAWLAAEHGGSRGVRVVKAFLTPDGRRPQTGDGTWRPVSFRSLAAAFRREWAAAPPGAERGYLRYYVAGLLKDVCREDLPVRPEGDDPYTARDLLTRPGAVQGEGERE